MDDAVLSIYTIYDNPADAADPARPFAVCEFEIRAGAGEPVWVRAWWAVDLPGARALVPALADTRLPRDLGDEPQIVESWV